ncbi:hypothetical protein GNIT_1922 [Glaciecola nitratireducens FR1064]|uniref:Uncharacterized protein n=1 Tax=Glaciecola nitratireducens (strain JCM 12485 / KCTC 12276 / FR1064) TaxID=1085623 RepID=G4QKG5_GLANF|nr:hypothetical protein GNIT_1922 [Glaciecola nitratireducens FR1064]
MSIKPFKARKLFTSIVVNCLFVGFQSVNIQQINCAPHAAH